MNQRHQSHQPSPHTTTCRKNKQKYPAKKPPKPPSRLSRGLLLKNLRSISIKNNNLGLPLRRLNRILSLEDSSQFLESAFTRLNEEEINNDKFERIPEDEEEVVFPARAGECDFRHEGIVEAGYVYEELDRDMSV